MAEDYEKEVQEFMAIVARSDESEEVFCQWFTRCEGRLRRSLGSFPDAVDAEAIVQETATLVWERTATNRPDGRPWITPDGLPGFLLRYALTVARNKAVDAKRRADREDRDRKRFPDAGRTGEPDAADPEEKMEERSLLERVRACAGRLEGAPRRALDAIVQDGGGQRLRELALSIGMEYDAFRKNLQRARRAVEECLRSHGIRPEEYRR